MAEWDADVKRWVLEYEGGFVNHPRDPGGATNMGITRRTLAAWRGHPVSVQDVRDLTKSEAMAIYKAHYWDAVQGDRLPRGLDYAVYDYAVNSGPGRAARDLQRCLGVTVDGIIGAQPQIVYQARNADNSKALAAKPNGTIGWMHGLQYEVDSTATGSASATNDLGVPGLVPFGTVYPEHFGSVGDGVTDDTGSLTALHDYCNLTGSPFLYPSKTYKVSGTVTVQTSGDMSAATITHSNTGTGPTIRIGSAAASDEIFQLSVHAPSVINTATVIGSGWAGTVDSIGLEICNLYTSEVHIKTIRKFGCGLLMTANQTGCVYNKIYIGDMYHNKKNLRVAPKTGTGWVNENQYFGGRYRYGLGDGLDIPNARNISIEDTASTPNANVFVGGSIEGNVAEHHIYCEGFSNAFYEMRYEASPCKVMISGATTFGNRFIGGYALDNVQFLYGGVSLGAEKRQTIFADGKTVINGSRNVLSVGAGSTSEEAAHALLVYPPLADNLNGSDGWGMNAYPNGLQGKFYSQAFPQIELDWVYEAIKIGDGNSPPVKVLGVQQAAVADDTSGASNQATVNAILAALRAHGLIAT